MKVIEKINESIGLYEIELKRLRAEFDRLDANHPHECLAVTIKIKDVQESIGHLEKLKTALLESKK